MYVCVWLEFICIVFFSSKFIQPFLFHYGLFYIQCINFVGYNFVQVSLDLHITWSLPYMFFLIFDSIYMKYNASSFTFKVSSSSKYQEWICKLPSKLSLTSRANCIIQKLYNSEWECDCRRCSFVLDLPLCRVAILQVGVIIPLKDIQFIHVMCSWIAFKARVRTLYIHW